MTSLYPTIARSLQIPIGKPFKLKPKHGKPYPSQYCFTNRDMVWRKEPSWEWASVSTNSMQMRIFFAFMRGDVEIVFDDSITWR